MLVIEIENNQTIDFNPTETMYQRTVINTWFNTWDLLQNFIL